MILVRGSGGRAAEQLPRLCSAISGAIYSRGGDAKKAREKLGWEPKVTFKELVRMMVDHDLELARQEQTLKSAGHEVALRGLKR